MTYRRALLIVAASLASFAAATASIYARRPRLEREDTSTRKGTGF